MPSVRELLAAAKQAGGQSTPEQALPGVPAGEPKPALAEDKQQQKQGEQNEMADRIRQAAQRRTELARQEVERRQDEVKFHEQRLIEATKHELPQGEVSADMNEAQQRLNEAKFDLARAEEAQFNTELAANQKLVHQEEKLGPTQKLPDSPKEGEGTANKPSVRDKLKSFFSKSEGGTSNNEAVAAPKAKL